MPADEPTGSQTGQRRYPVCWTWFTPNPASNPHPRRYCCGAYRIEASRRRRRRDNPTTPGLPRTGPDQDRAARAP